VERGEQRGRILGYPTANVPTHDQAAPADGVYAGWLYLLDPCDDQNRVGDPFPVAISVGTNPTFDGERERRVEAYVIDRADLDLYDQRVEISFVAHIRGMVKFDGVDALVTTMAHDVKQTRELLGI
jgi:riboflavin kinase/FMN adenylyltransferase